MPSRKSSFNKTVYLKTLQRFWPLWAACAATWFLAVPMAVLSRQSYNGADSGIILNYRQEILSLAAGVSPIICFIFAILAAMACFGWLYQNRSTAFTASLPVSRDTMFRSSAAAGLTAMLAAVLLAAVLALLCGLAKGVALTKELSLLLAVGTLDTLCFFGFAVLCAQLTGSIIILPLVYVVLNFTFAAVEELVRYVINRLCYGISWSGSFLSLLSPLVGRMQHCGCVPIRGEAVAPAYRTPIIGYRFSGWGWALAYGLFGIVCLALAARLYRRRRMETAGDTVAIDVLKPVFRWCLSLGCGLVLSAGVNALLNDGVSVPGTASEALRLGVLQVLGAVIGWMAADMLIYRSFGAFNKHLKGMVLPCLLLALFTFAVEADLTGAERRVPSPEKIARADVRAYGEVTTLPEEALGELEEVHRSIIANKDLHEQGFAEGCTPVEIHYYGEDGIILLSREYAVARSAAQAGDPNSDLRKVEALVNRPGCALSRCSIQSPVSAQEVVSASLHLYSSYGDVYESGAFAADKLPLDWMSLTPTEAAELFNECVLPDLQDGTLGRLSLVNDEAYGRRVYNLTFELELGRLNGDNAMEFIAYCAVSPTVDSVRTNAWLKAHGVELETLWDYLSRTGHLDDLEYLGAHA